jgi:hypothetical protein
MMHGQKNVKLIKTTMLCCKWGSQMSWCVDTTDHVDTNRNDGYRWPCRRKTSASVCSASTPVRHRSFFRQSNLKYMDVLFLTYNFRRVPAQTIQQEHQFGSVTIINWANVCRGAIFDYALGSSQKIGGVLQDRRN